MWTLFPFQRLRYPKATKENHFHYLFSIYIFCTFTSLFEPAPALQVVQHITMSLKSLVISFPWPCHYSSPALPLWPFLSLSRCSSNPALLQRLKIKEIKHRYWVLACELPWCKGKTIRLYLIMAGLSLATEESPMSPSFLFTENTLELRGLLVRLIAIFFTSFFFLQLHGLWCCSLCRKA